MAAPARPAPQRLDAVALRHTADQPQRLARDAERLGELAKMHVWIGGQANEQDVAACGLALGEGPGERAEGENAVTDPFIDDAAPR